jgi:hypothetical protein
VKPTALPSNLRWFTPIIFWKNADLLVSAWSLKI